MAEAILPMMAANAMNAQRPHYVESAPVRHHEYDYDGRRDRWDIERDNLMQFANTREKIAEESGRIREKIAEDGGLTRTKITEEHWKLSDSIKDNRHASDMQYADLSKQSEINTAKVISEQKDSERRILDRLADDARRKLELENQKLYTENSQLRYHERRGPRVYDCPEYGYAAAG